MTTINHQFRRKFQNEYPHFRVQKSLFLRKFRYRVEIGYRKESEVKRLCEGVEGFGFKLTYAPFQSTGERSVSRVYSNDARLIDRVFDSARYAEVHEAISDEAAVALTRDWQSDFRYRIQFRRAGVNAWSLRFPATDDVIEWVGDYEHRCEPVRRARRKEPAGISRFHEEQTRAVCVNDDRALMLIRLRCESGFDVEDVCSQA